MCNSHLIRCCIVLVVEWWDNQWYSNCFRLFFGVLMRFAYSNNIVRMNPLCRQCRLVICTGQWFLVSCRCFKEPAFDEELQCSWGCSWWNSYRRSLESAKNKWIEWCVCVYIVCTTIVIYLQCATMDYHDYHYNDWFSNYHYWYWIL